MTDVTRFWADARGWTAKAAQLTGEAVPVREVSFAPPVPPSARVICVGLNYRAHAAEGSFDVPEHPTLFGRWTAALSVGDVVATGTPDGVGYVRTPPWLLKPGDVVEAEIDRLGTLRTPVVSRDPQENSR
ncbi:fumarylacetoacetate hydrolase family protein [Actinomadura sp. ATCC 31491]|uniref:Fumarylacetoacetate hydrolase family protein n=1 Tax=Actinomadura luzonensis TaxID=2805427 RepID=A0ABT0G7A2_9ACTN|nr:fumarylacetoacetate hydrolase family protein [Actinomadura luzonensis]MCK2220462.1 fumarylacetoacetate hydrolase family protein [Actinomadura luzonensis]